jgi:hypothetical protein
VIKARRGIEIAEVGVDVEVEVAVKGLLAGRDETELAHDVAPMRALGRRESRAATVRTAMKGGRVLLRVVNREQSL